MATHIGFEFLSARLFPTPESVREFVAGDAFSDLMVAVSSLVEFDSTDSRYQYTDHAVFADARDAGWELAHDLTILAQAAARGEGVEESKSEPSIEWLAQIAERAAALAKVVEESEMGRDPVDTLMDLVAEILRAHAAPSVPEVA